MAERYRTGDGVPRDSAQAVHWLWRAVAKESGEALERLAVMYAAGEGVAKDCDQAHVLAGAAGRKLPQDVARVQQELRAAGCE
jgi:TPR repeat protein